MTSYHFYGFRLASEIPLPALAPVAGARSPDITLRLGPVGDHLPDPVWGSPYLEIGSGGDVLAKIGNGLRFHIRDGSQITLQTADAGAGGEIETHLSSLIAGVVLHQRDELALHASAIAMDGSAVAFSGASGLGKSTLASAMVLRGYPLLTDDVCRVQFGDGDASVEPGPPRLRLWPDIVRRLGKAPEELVAGRANHPKRLLTEIAKETVARPLRTLIRLGIDPRVTAPTIEPVRGPASVMPIDDLVYRTRLGRRLGRKVGIFTKLTRLGGLVRIFRLVRPEGVTDLSALVALVETAAREA